MEATLKQGYDTMKSLRSTFALLFIVALFGAYIYFNERGPIADSGAAVLLRIDAQQVNQIVLAQKGSELRLKKEGTMWKVQRDKSNVAVPADETIVQNLLDGLRLIQAPQALSDDPKQRKEFGLEKPSATLQVNDAKIEFGTSPPFDSTKVYARVSNSGKTQVALVSNDLKTAAIRPFPDWRDKTVLPVTSDDVQSVSVKAPAIAATFDKTKAAEEGILSEWKVAKPLSAKAESSTVESLLTQLNNTQSPKFFDDNPKNLSSWGLDKPQAQLELVTKDGSRDLLIGKKTAGGYAAKNSLSPAVFEVPDSLFGLLNRPLRDWRDKKFLQVEAENLQKITVTFRGATKTFAKSGDKWAEEGVKTDNTAQSQKATDETHRAVMDLIFSVQGLEAQDFADSTKSDVFTKPWVKISLDSTSLQVAEKEKLYAQANSEPAVVLPPSAHDSLQKPLDKLFPKK